MVYGFGAVCRALENDELIELMVGNCPVSISDVVLRLSLLIKDSDVGFACEHFVSLDHSMLPVNILELLLSDDRLTINSEDWLLKIIEDRISNDHSLIDLLDYVECKYLSVEGMSSFISLMSNESMSSSVWSSLCRRLEQPVSVANVNPRTLCRSVRLNPDRPFDGVFAHLWCWCRENPHKAGLIAISANNQDSKHKCEGLLSEGKSFVSGNSAVDHYVKIDLKNMSLIPSGYSVKTHGNPWKGYAFVRSWRFEGSDDDSDWKVLDSHTDSDELMENDKEVSFAISTTTSFRFLRFVMTGVNSSGTHEFLLQRLEFFGLLQSTRQ
jgi:hypothetical protein